MRFNGSTLTPCQLTRLRERLSWLIRFLPEIIWLIQASRRQPLGPSPPGGSNRPAKARARLSTANVLNWPRGAGSSHLPSLPVNNSVCEGIQVMGELILFYSSNFLFKTTIRKRKHRKLRNAGLWTYQLSQTPIKENRVTHKDNPNTPATNKNQIW